MQATARRRSVVSATSTPRRRLIRDVRPRTKSAANSSMLAQIIDQAERREPSKFTKVVRVVLPSIIAVCWGVSWLRSHDFGGGLRSSYPAEDFDSRLTQEARLALPLIKAIRAYRDSHSHKLPPNLDVIRADLPHTTDLRDKMTHGWTYVPEDSGQFRLYRKLGWDPALWFEEVGGADTWTFDPGDGAPAKNLKLKP